MPAELTLLTDVEPTREALVAIAAESYPDGVYVDYRGGDIKQFIDEWGTPLLCLFGTRPVLEVAEASAALADPPTSFGLWTDLTIPFGGEDPFGDDGRGRALAEAIAAGLGGRVCERN